MTNEQYIFMESQKLAKEGKIKYTGRVFETELPDGSKQIVKETEAIHTYEHWKQLGFQVQRGQKAVAQLNIWKHVNGRVNDETGSQEPSRMFMKKSSFFSASQVQAIA